MGRYSSLSDLCPSLMQEQVAVQIVTDDPSATVFDGDSLALLDSYIEEAEAEVDGYLGIRYALPLASVPSLVTRLSARILRYRVYTGRPGLAEEAVIKDYESAVKMLEGIRDGKISLGLTPLGADPGATSQTGRRVRASSRAPVFGRGNMEGF